MGRTIINVKVADVEKRRLPSKHYVYVIRVTWSDGTMSVIYRRYSQFFNLQNAILDKFPSEAGTYDPMKRIIPFLPGKILFGRSHIRKVALDRLEMIGKYCTSLIHLPEKISTCREVMEFFGTNHDDIMEQKYSNIQETPKVQPASTISNPMLLEQYVAIADYTAEGTHETSLTEGALVGVVEKADTGWWFVSGDDGQGWVPSSYLETHSGEDEDRVLQKASEGFGEKFVCSRSYRAIEEDEINMEKGSLVEVLERNLDGWWLVKCNEKVGRVPATFLVKTDSLKAKRLLSSDGQYPVEIVPNAMAVSNLPGSKSPAKSPTKSATSDVQIGRVDNSDMSSVNKPVIAPAGSSSDFKNRLQEQLLNRGMTAQDQEEDDFYDDDEWDDDETEQSNGPLRMPPRRESISTGSRAKRPTSVVKDETCEVITEYISDMEEGIKLKQGQTYKVVEKTSNGWVYLQNDSQEGWAPTTYVQRSSSMKPNLPLPPKHLGGPYSPNDNDDDDWDEPDSSPAKQIQNPRNMNQLREVLVGNKGPLPPPLMSKPPPSGPKPSLPKKPPMPVKPNAGKGRGWTDL